MEKGSSIGALYELSGVDMGRRKKRSQAEKKKKREERKEHRKKVFKKVAKVGLAPARASFLLAVRVNALRLATKLARGYKKDPNKIKSFWSKFNGDWDKLKEAISKGSHESLSGAMPRNQMGSATLLAIATATPIIVALLPILKDLKANGDMQEEKEFLEGLEKGKQDLANDPNIEKSNALTDPDFNSGKVESEDPDTTETPSWVMPVALIGGAGLLYLVTKK